ncbi:hypothetical protein ACFRAO_44510 [Streptomyces sp. NPDC056656]|uniref:hypothetical protein n=1 Tax=Streptomyces sp. NPDC056656 TaxID=3345895 RepID=UPI00369451A9
MSAPYHEAFWGLLGGVASAVILAQVVVNVVVVRAVKAVSPTGSTDLPDGPWSREQWRVALTLWLSLLGYAVQWLVLFECLSSLAQGWDNVEPMWAGGGELLLVAFLPFATRSSEHFARDLNRSINPDTPESG